jgi:hypothetical protein
MRIIKIADMAGYERSTVRIELFRVCGHEGFSVCSLETSFHGQINCGQCQNTAVIYSEKPKGLDRKYTYLMPVDSRPTLPRIYVRFEDSSKNWV